MIAPIRELQRLLVSADGPTSPPSVGDPFLARVRDAIAGLFKPSPETGPADLAGLLRQGMLRCQLARGEDAELRVIRGEGWPDEAIWQQASCDTSVAGVGHFFVRPRPWQPSWLDHGAQNVVEAAIREQPRRRSRPVVADPLVAEFMGHLEYVSPGQRAAVHAAFLIPPGSTAILNLPTGGGKTLAFQLPALAWAAHGGLTLVVVPTIALARDQEDRFRDILGRLKTGRTQSAMPVAYYGALDDTAKGAIRTAMRDGSQSIVFASPEAVIGPLRGVLFEVARQGRLKVFAIDEAHVVTQWGQHFRPEFQSIAGLKDALLAECPETARFRTLLLTATLTADCCETLRYLFGSGGCQVVSEVALRPEPGFLIDSVSNETERLTRIMEAIPHLPKPLILYTTLREDAASWHARLNGAGFRRVRLVRGGDLGEVAGAQMLRDWRSSAVDIVVATSAFGLGMDQQEVRSVVHACLPETIDRYYQEVGRAGRDGNAAVALIITADADLATAEALGREQLISIDRGFERWHAMWVRHQATTNDTYVVSLDDRPVDISDTGSHNASWNLRTLVLMARSGLITFAPHPPPLVERLGDEDDTTFDERRRKLFDRFSREVAVRICDSRHSHRTHWNNAVAQTRRALRAADEHGLTLVRELRDLRRPLNDIFREVYTLSEPSVRPPRLVGSCPVTRQRGIVSFQSPDPEVITITETCATLSREFERALAPCADEVGRFWVEYQEPLSDARDLRRWRESLHSLLKYAVASGVTELSLQGGVFSGLEWSQLTARAPLRLLIRADADSSRVTPAPPVPRLTFLSQEQVSQADFERVMVIHRPRHIIVVPKSAPDPTRPSRRLLDVVRHLSVDDLLARLQA